MADSNEVQSYSSVSGGPLGPCVIYTYDAAGRLTGMASKFVELGEGPLVKAEDGSLAHRVALMYYLDDSGNLVGGPGEVAIEERGSSDRRPMT